MNPSPPFPTAPRRVSRRVFWIAACLAVTLAAGPAAAGDDVWITLGADAFDSASSLFSSGVEGRPLPRLGEAKGVVLTRVPRSGLDALSARLHEDFRRCSGFIAHESLEEGQEELARVSSASRTAGGAGFAIDQPQWVEEVAGAVSEAQILNTITSLSTGFPNRYHAHPSGTAAVNWIRDLWLGYAAGHPGVTVELATHPNTPQRSVILKIPGTTLANEVVILGGHLDSIAPGTSNPNFSAPGADDDASGIATISEVARVLLASGFQPQRTLHIIGYAAEEVGLRGSTNLAATYQAAGVNVVAVLQQDMTDYHGSTQDMAFLTDFTNANLTAFLIDLLETYQPDLDWTTTACGYACSDHAPWFNRGYPTSLAAEARIGEDNPWIHTTNDTVATLGNSAAHAAKFARLAAAYLVEAGRDGSNALFSDGFESGDTDAWSGTVP